MKRVLATVILALAAASAGVLPAIPAGADATTAVPAFCSASGPVPATAISAPLDLGKCPIQKREIVLPASIAPVTAGVPVPPPGQAITNSTLTKTGEYSLTAANLNGQLTVSESHATGNPARSAIAATATDPACSETAYNYERYGTTGAPDYWTGTLDWYYTESTASRANLTIAATESDIRGGNTNMTTGQNDCGYPTGQFRSHGAFQGNTSKYANIDSSGNCTSNFPDLQNTVSWGPYTGTALTSGTLADTCYDAYINTGKMIEADIYFGSNVRLVDTLPAGCTSSYDLQSTATHEWGHAYGMAHETSGPDETMYPYENPCKTYERTLGNGDWHGMDNLYP